jgi:TP901 family phage tail tape measure protein
MVAQAAARELNVTGTQAAERAKALAAEKQITREMVAQAAARELNVTGTQAAERAKALEFERGLTRLKSDQAAIYTELLRVDEQRVKVQNRLRDASASPSSIKAFDEASLENAKRNVNARNTLYSEEYAAEQRAAKSLLDLKARTRAQLKIENDAVIADAVQHARRLKEVEAANARSIAYLSATPRQQASQNLRAAVAVERGYSTARLAPEAVSAATNLGSIGAAKAAVDALAASHKALAPATKESAASQIHWNKVANEGHAAARGLAGSLGTLWITYGSLIPLLSGAALGAAFKQTATAGSEFAYQLAFVKALGEETESTMGRLSDAAKTLGQNSLQGPVELASGFRILAQAGLSGTDAIIAMNSVLDLAVVGEMDMAQAGTTLVGVMNAFGLSVNSASHVGDVFAKAAALSQTSVQGMTESMKTASVVGQQYGASLEDTATALTLLAKVNITNTAAGTSLRNMLKELYAPTKQAAGTFKDLGLEVADAQGKLKTFPEIIFELKDKLEGFDKISQVNILQRMFGERGAKEAIVMLAETRESWDKLNQSISNSSGFMRQVSSELEETTKGTFKQAMNALQTAFVSVFDKAEGPMKDMAIRLKTMFASEEFKANVAATVALLSNVASATLSVIGAVSTLINMLPDGAAGFALWVAGLSTLIPKLLAFGTTATATSVAVATIGGTSAAAATAGLASTGAAAATAASVGFAPLAIAVGLVTVGYVLFSSKTPGVINSVNALNSALDTQISRLRLVNSELQRKNTLDSGGGDVEISRAKRDLALAEGKLREYNAKIEKSKSGQQGSILTGSSANKSREDYVSASEATRYKSELERKIREAKLNMAIAEGYEDQNRIEGNRASVNQQLKEKEALEKMRTGTKVYSPPNASERAGGSSGGSGRAASKDERSILNSQMESALRQERIQLGTRLIEVETELADQTISATVATQRKNEATTESLKTEGLLLEKSMEAARAANDKAQIEKVQGQIDENKLKLLRQTEQATLDNTRVNTANRNSVKDLATASSRYVEDLALERVALDMTADEVADLRIERERLRAVEDLKVRIDREQVEPAVAEAEKAAIAARAEAQKREEEFQRSFVGGWKKAYKEWADNASSEYQRAADTFAAVTRGMNSALDEFVRTGKINFSNLAQAIIADIAMIEARALIAKATSSLGAMFGGGGGFGGIIGGLVQGVAGMFGGGAGVGGNLAAALNGFEGLDHSGYAAVADMIDSAKGNVFSGSPSLHAYANTVQTSPKTFAFQNLHGFARGGVFAEAGPEAVMPLKRDSAGRLGVQSEGSGSTINVYVTVNAEGGAEGLRRSAGQIARQVGTAVSGVRKYA